MDGPAAPPAGRLRAGLRRHGLIRRPAALREAAPTGALRFRDGNRLTLYETGRAGLASMLAAIESARQRVHLETYILRDDETGRRFVTALTERARASAEVRLLYDAVGSRGLPEALFAELRRAGGEVVAFNPLRRLWPRFAPRRRDHRKILIVDGSVAFTGGLNVGDEYDRGEESGGLAWRDFHVRVEGPCVRDLEGVFLESWFRADAPDLPWHDLLAAAPPAAGDVRCAVLADGPLYRRRRARGFLLSALEHTEQRAALVSPYFAPGTRVLDALARAARRGVSVELMLAGRTDHPLLRRAARSIVPRLLDAGVRVFEYQRSMMHGKAAAFDDSLAVIGTSNLDRQSFEHSYEVNVVIDGGDVPARLRESFERDLALSSSIDSEALARRGLREWLVDRLAALLLYFV